MEDSLEKVEILAKRLFELHPSEAELVIRLFTGDLRIGLQGDLVLEAVEQAFHTDVGAVRDANMFTGDPGLAAVLAREGRLSEAVLTPLVAIHCMPVSASVLTGAGDGMVTNGLPFSEPFWLEAEYDGIRAQLHKVGGEVALFSKDLRPLDLEFPELIEAAKGLEGDFILDGELIAYAEGRKLGFADLQKRLGRLKAEGDLFMEAAGDEVPVPLKYVAFDLLWVEGEVLLDLTLAERRDKLTKLPLDGIFSVIGLLETNDMVSTYRQALLDGHKGLIAKDPGSIYSPGRTSGSWVRIGMTE